MLNDHNTSVSKELFWIIINQLSIDENIRFVCKNFIDFSLHLLFFGFLDISDFQDGINLNLGSQNLNLISVHLGVGNHDLWVRLHLLATGGDLLLEDKAISQIRVTEGATWLLNDFDVIQVTGALKPQNGLDGQLSELVSLGFQKL